MISKISILYAWFVKITTFLLPDTPFFMRLRGSLYSLMMKECGRNFQVTATVILNPLSGLKVGNDVYIAHYSVLIGNNIEIGDEVLIGPGCTISSSNHSYLENSYRFGKRIEGKVLIGNGCWISGNCSIVKDTALPPRSILAAGAVLTKKMNESDTIYGGIPARKIRNVKI